MVLLSVDLLRTWFFGGDVDGGAGRSGSCGIRRSHRDVIHGAASDTLNNR